MPKEQKKRGRRAEEARKKQQEEEEAQKPIETFAHNIEDGEGTDDPEWRENTRANLLIFRRLLYGRAGWI